MVALCLIGMDVFVLGSPIFSIIGIGFLFLAAGIAALLFLFRDKAFSKLYAFKAMIYGLALIVVFGIFKANAHLGHENALKIVDAIKSYKQDRGGYPEELGQLVPAYMASIPKCSYTTGCKYHYLSSPDYHSLMWTTVQPFGRRIYEFESDQWRYHD
jgi:hypothetical protein